MNQLNPEEIIFPIFGKRLETFPEVPPPGQLQAVLSRLHVNPLQGEDSQ